MTNVVTACFRRHRRSPLVAAWRRGRNGQLQITWTTRRYLPRMAASSAA